VLLVSGVTLVKLFDGDLLMQIVGVALIPLGLVTSVIGLQRYMHIRESIKSVEED
jgi:hypothetical protein